MRPLRPLELFQIPDNSEQSRTRMGSTPFRRPWVAGALQASDAMAGSNHLAVHLFGGVHSKCDLILEQHTWRQ